MNDRNMPPRKKIKLETSNAMEASSQESQSTNEDVIEDTSEMPNETHVEPEVYEDMIDPEELERLKEFKVLDEVKSDDEDSNDEESDSTTDGKSEGVPEEELERMLDENLPEGFKGAPKPKEKLYTTRQKIFLEEKGINQFEVLPLEWIMVRHHSGMPVYMHRSTRVCTLSKPYFLGKGNTRRHDIPICAIPCLSYRKALEEERKQKEREKKIAEQIDQINSENGPNSSESNDQTETENETQDAKESLLRQIQDMEEEQSNTTKKCPFAHIKQEEDALTEMFDDPSHNEIKTELLEMSNDVTKVDSIKTEEVSINGDINFDVESNTQPPSGQNSLDGEECDVEINTKTQNSPNGEILQNVSVVSVNGEECDLASRPVVLPGGIVMPPPRVEAVNSSWKTQQLTPLEVNDYCKNLFQFRTVNIMHFKRWADRRRYTKARKTLQYPTLPAGTKLITIPAVPSLSQEPAGFLGGGKASKRDWVMNMNGRSYLSVFHEYVRRALQKQPVYEFKQLENAATPYQAVVYIGGMQYGVGRGTSKRQAKANAARASIQILVPEIGGQEAPAQDHTPDFSFFDYCSIEDPRITEFCAATCEPSPHAILRTCLLRNFGTSERHIVTEMKKLEYQKIELTMKVGKHTATVVCKNKKTAKQRASQAILQALHPHVRSWGSLLRLYGSRSVKSCKEKKLEEQQITLLQDKARQNEPNYAVLEKLRAEMHRLKERDEAVQPIGTLLVQHDLPAASGSGLNTVEL